MTSPNSEIAKPSTAIYDMKIQLITTMIPYMNKRYSNSEIKEQRRLIEFNTMKNLIKLIYGKEQELFSILEAHKDDWESIK